MYQNNLKNIAFFKAMDIISYLPDNTKENVLWESEKINVKFHNMTPYTWNFQNFTGWFTCVFTIIVKFDIYFLGLPWETVFGVITDN